MHMNLFALVIADTRLALRGLLRRPGHALGVVLTLALGIGVCAAMFSIVQGVLLRGLEFPDSSRLFVLESASTTGGGRGALSGAEAESLGEVPSLEAAGYYLWGGVTDHGGERPRMLSLISVGGELFRTLGVQPQLGRWLDLQDVNRDSGVVISHALWQERFGGDPGVIGQPFEIDWVRSRVVGVMPPDFGFPARGVDFWIGYDVERLRAEPALYQNARFMQGVARLAPDATAAQLARDLAAHSERLAEQHGAALRDWRLGAQSLLDSRVGQVRPVLLALLAIAALALAVACANVINLVVLRGLARQQELALHQALGASRMRLAVQVFLETLMLGVVATALGVLAAQLALRGFIGLADSAMPRAQEVGVDAAALLGAVGIGLGASLLAALLPALRLWRRPPGVALRAGDSRSTAGRSEIGRLLPVAACAVSVAGLATALLLAGSLRQLQNAPLGYSPDSVLVLNLFRDPDPGRGAYARSLVEALRELPGVTAAAAISSAPLSVFGQIPVDVQVQGREGMEPLRPRIRTASGPIEQVLGLRLLRGRWLEPGDHAEAEPVAIVNRSFVQRVFPSAEPLGQHLTLPPFGTPGERLRVRIVGVMEDARMVSVAASPEPEVWLPDAQYGVSSLALLARTEGEPGLLMSRAQQAVWEQQPQQGIYSGQLLSAQVDAQLAAPRFFARNAGAFALLALLLAAIGVHSVVAYQMTRRQREFALRLAVGARPRSLAGQVLGSGLRLGLPAALLGIVLGGVAAQLLRGTVVELDAALWLAPPLAALLLLAVVGLACLSSMRRALHVQPMSALRGD